MNWEKTAQVSFDAVLAKVPVFLRPVAQRKVSQRAEANARERSTQLNEIKVAGPLEVSLKDVVDAFFMETPFGFHGPLKMDMEALGIDYQKYGHSK